MQTTPLAPKKMNWHMILIYGLLWLIAFMDLTNGLIGVFGVQLGPTADGGMGVALHVYPDMAHPQLFILDGVFALIMCLYTVFVRFQLSGMKRRGPLLLTIMFVLNIIESVVYFLVLRSFASSELLETLGATGNMVGMVAFSAITAGLTHIYYSKRSDLFVN